MDYPKCFDSSDEFEAWILDAERDFSDLPSPRFSFCSYCCKGYQSDMIQQGRCQNPDLDFSKKDFEEYQTEFWEELSWRA